MSTELKLMRIHEIVPYWRNPRVITEEAVTRTAESIEKYGYQQPIILDSKNVIIAGHTRYAALKRLGWAEVPVIVSDLDAERARAYRIVDNKTGEYSGWDTDLLRSELAKFGQEVIDTFFPNMGEMESISEVPVLNSEDFTEMFEESGLQDVVEEETIPLTCIHCFEETAVPVSEWLSLADKAERAIHER